MEYIDARKFWFLMVMHACGDKVSLADINEGMKICAVPAEDTERMLRKIKEMEAWNGDE